MVIAVPTAKLGCYLGPGYMFPRSDDIILGGTFERDDWSIEPKRETTDGF